VIFGVFGKLCPYSEGFKIAPKMRIIGFLRTVLGLKCQFLR